MKINDDEESVFCYKNEVGKRLGKKCRDEIVWVTAVLVRCVGYITKHEDWSG